MLRGGLPLFAGVESTEDLLISTLEEMDKDVTSELMVNHPLYFYYKENNLIEYRDTIGPYVPVKIMDKQNTTVKDHSGYDQADLTPQDALTEARFLYGQFAGTQMYNREEITKNANNILDLVKIKQDQLQESMANHFGDLIMGSQDADGKRFMGFRRVMEYNAPCGGIDPTQSGFEYWNPKRGLKAGGSQFSLATEMRPGMRFLERECTYNGEAPKLWICGADFYDAIQAYLEGKALLTPKDVKNQGNGDFSDFNMFSDNKNRTYIYDASLDPKEGWLINTKRLVIRVHSGTNFQFMPWETVPGAVAAKSRQCLTYASVYCKRRRVHGKIVFS